MDVSRSLWAAGEHHAVGYCARGCGTRVAWPRRSGVRLGDLPCPRCGRGLRGTDRIGPAPWIVLDEPQARALVAGGSPVDGTGQDQDLR